MLSVTRETPDQPDVLHLLEQADARSASLYPAESRFGLDLAGLLAQAVRFFVARLDGRTVGCGGYALGRDQDAELKRIFVLPAARGQGVGQALVLAIEHAAAAAQARWMRLETGVKSVEALHLYQRLGYRERGPFGAYLPDPLSVFMEKQLAPPDATPPTVGRRKEGHPEGKRA